MKDSEYLEGFRDGYKQAAEMVAYYAGTVADRAETEAARADGMRPKPSAPMWDEWRGEYRLVHVCEVCGRVEVLTPTEADEQGWDYPPARGAYGLITPRTCGDCSIKDTLWWRLTTDPDAWTHLSDHDKETLRRIEGEPWTLNPEGKEAGGNADRICEGEHGRAESGPADRRADGGGSRAALHVLRKSDGDET